VSGHLPGYMLSFPKTGYCRISIGDTLEEAKADAIAASNNLQQPCSLLLRADYSVIGYTSRQKGDNFMAFEFRNRT